MSHLQFKHNVVWQTWTVTMGSIWPISFTTWVSVYCKARFISSSWSVWYTVCFGLLVYTFMLASYSAIFFLVQKLLLTFKPVICCAVGISKIPDCLNALSSDLPCLISVLRYLASRNFLRLLKWARELYPLYETATH